MRLFVAIIDAVRRRVGWFFHGFAVFFNRHEYFGTHPRNSADTSPELREEVMRFVQSLDEPAHPPLLGGTTPEHTPSKHESKNCH